MVYRDKPSAGCEPCRKAKKRCGLEQPKCLRCVKLNKDCTGYRDTFSLQIQDESESVRQKALKQQGKNASSSRSPRHLSSSMGRTESIWKPRDGLLTPFSPDSDPNSSSYSASDAGSPENDQIAIFTEHSRPMPGGGMSLISISLQLKPDDIADNYFYSQFNMSWQYNLPAHLKEDACLCLAVRACGMIALTNVQMVPGGKSYAATLYGEALAQLNQALQHPSKSKADETLIAVTMLGYYENLACESTQSMEHWKAHIAGATQMLKLRGKQQLRSVLGRMLFRETRAQVLVTCMWDDAAPPAFLEDWQPDLEKRTVENLHGITTLGDKLVSMWLYFARLRRQLFSLQISIHQCWDRAIELEQDLIQWSKDMTTTSEFWQYHEIDVDDSAHVWNGRILSYAGNPAPTFWNQWRVFRTMVSRTQGLLCQRLDLSAQVRAERIAHNRRVQRTMSDDICATIPVCLGHATPASSSSCILITAYSSLWPLFMAGTCLIERAGEDAKALIHGTPPSDNSRSAAFAQASWILGRLDYVSKNVGLRWADSIASVLKGDAKLSENVFKQPATMAQKAPWLRHVSGEALTT